MNGVHYWKQMYERTMCEIFVWRRETASEISDPIRISGGAEKNVSFDSKFNMVAHEHVVMAESIPRYTVAKTFCTLVSNSRDPATIFLVSFSFCSSSKRARVRILVVVVVVVIVARGRRSTTKFKERKLEKLAINRKNGKFRRRI